jgi:hypothetical protein
MPPASTQEIALCFIDGSTRSGGTKWCSEALPLQYPARQVPRYRQGDPPCRECQTQPDQAVDGHQSHVVGQEQALAKRMQQQRTIHRIERVVCEARRPWFLLSPDPIDHAPVIAGRRPDFTQSRS